MKKLILVFVSFILLLGCSEREEIKPIKDSTSIWIEQKSNTEADLTDVFFIDDSVGIVSGSSGTLLKTNNAGKTWEKLNVGISHSFTCVFAVNKSTFFTARVGLYKTEDSGATFTEKGGLSSYSNSIFDVKFFNGSEGLLIKGPLVLKTDDGGSSWSSVYDAGFVGNMQFPTRKVGFLTGGISYDGRSSGEIHKTEDGGLTWKRLEVPTSEITACHFVNDKLGFFFNFTGQLYKTTDGGLNWKPIETNLKEYIFDLLFIDENVGYAVSYDGLIYKTSNSGRSWTEEFKSVKISPITAIVMSPDNTLYAVGNNGVILKRKK